MPTSGTVKVWVVDLSQVPNWLNGLLSGPERERAQRLRNAAAAQRWAASRAVLRDLLGQATGTDPAALQFELGRHGKPYLHCFPLPRPPHFNMSHSGELAVYALSRDREVGVDVESLDRGRGSRNELAIAERLLSPRVVERLRSLPPERRTEEFLRAWVAHEAFVKCLGHGLDQGSKGGTPATQAGVWVTPLEVGDEAVASLATKGGPVGVEVQRWGP